jgi:hypothetical protein
MGAGGATGESRMIFCTSCYRHISEEEERYNFGGGKIRCNECMRCSICKSYPNHDNRWLIHDLPFCRKCYEENSMSAMSPDALLEFTSKIKSENTKTVESPIVETRDSLVHQLFMIEEKLDTLRERIYKLRERYEILRKQPHSKDGFIDLEQTKRDIDNLEADLEYKQLAAPGERQDVMEKIRKMDSLSGEVDKGSPFSELSGTAGVWSETDATRFLTILFEKYSDRINKILGQPPSARMYPERYMPEDLLEGRPLMMVSPTAMSGTRIVRTKIVEILVQSVGDKGGPMTMSISISSNGVKWYDASINRDEVGRCGYLVELAIESLHGLVKHELYEQHPD